VSRRFSDFMRELEEETGREGPDAIAEAEAFRAHFRLARELIERRRMVGLTQRELAKRSGVQQSEISRIEQGDANPTFQTMHVLARSLGAEFRLVNAGSPRAPRRRGTRLSARRAAARRTR
jgi:transcriptional regulator with XRE-family HTH domain